MAMSQRVCLCLGLLVGVASYRDGAFDATNSLELHSSGALVRRRMDDTIDRSKQGSAETQTALGTSNSSALLGAGPNPLDETPQGLQDDCTVELVPHARLQEFRDQLQEYVKEMINEFVDKVVQQGEEHETEATRIQRDMDAKSKATKAELIHMIRSFTIEQQRLMVMTRHGISGYCCCEKDFDQNHDGKLSVEEVNTHLSAGGDGLCKWVPRGKEGEEGLQGLRGILCPDALRWQYRDIVGSGARLTAYQIDKLIDYCVASEEWEKFVAKKVPIKKLNDDNKKLKDQGGSAPQSQQSSANAYSTP